MEQLKVGDTVLLKSGGPLMCVANLEGDKVTCGWFNKDDYCEEFVFSVGMVYQKSKEADAGGPDGPKED